MNENNKGQWAVERFVPNTITYNVCIHYNLYDVYIIYYNQALSPERVFACFFCGLFRRGINTVSAHVRFAFLSAADNESCTKIVFLRFSA